MAEEMEKETKKVSPAKKSTSTSTTKKTSTTTKTTSKPAASTTKKASTSAKSVPAPKVVASKQVKKLNFDTESLPKSVFGLKKIYDQAIFDTILSERASKHFTTHAVKTRGDVSGTGKKPFRQKGTGNARAGSLRSPIYVGGGRVFGPNVNRNYNLKVNKKVRKLALLSALTELAKEKAVLVHEYKIAKPSTRDLLIELNKKGLATLNRVLLVSSDENVFLSARNLPNVEVIKITSLSVEKLLAADVLILTKEDVKYLEGLAK
ncbi:50S ribosomal protein L4 [Metamycoplasma hyosynoviae]|uniref:50S ribosomal protein L4 n=1 Tax=Metamycoplasma hyosynoviae TaxID=29559 RepID=UPI002359C9D3|nr:50S ribosomal protein L4 [Metamycoplasma hyosynoviae]MDC8918575.1 50S ribosomal protein L4 [Metamycoplasma hyosynoviae]MDC8919577.1 50S ribosomal protein L4 [Metamycoplasma hyosynoviae]MDC8962618.1 50S ribosomal protein L4 [Metamycoplasma hyosynoviae]MDD1366230.1 50S ribosomal protein L4 [Metamycoplasma hyosynoviae]MDD1379082.1 50S ribosomal protein L4 [Metamycoplasma hyosynoviae]